MALSDYKITDNAVSTKGVVAAPDKLTGTANQNKMIFDRLIREAVKGLYNGLIDALAGAEGAAEIGLDVEGLDAETVAGGMAELAAELSTKAEAADVTAALALKADASALDTHTEDTGNPHSVSKDQVGLGNVDNTSDTDKPISTATQAALDGKQETLTFDTTPTAGSGNPVTSAGIKTAINNAFNAVHPVVIMKNSVSAATAYSMALDGFNNGLYVFVWIETTTSGDRDTILLRLTNVIYSNGLNAFWFSGAVGDNVCGISLQRRAWGDLVTVPINAVTSVNGDTGAVVLTQDDVGDGSTYVRTHNDLTDALVALINGALQTSGGTMSGGINMGGAAVTNVGTPTADADAATKKYVDDGLSAKQDALTFDTTPTENSTNPVTSGGVKTALDAKHDIFSCTYGTTTYAEITAALAAGKLPVCVMDGVELVYTKNIGAALDFITGHCFQGASNSSSTAAIYRAVCGTDSEWYSDSVSLATAQDLSDGLADKQNTLTFDTTPTANSTNPVTSGGIRTAIDSAVAAAIGAAIGGSY